MDEEDLSGAAETNPMESDPGKMFIGGLHPTTSADNLQRYFEKYGPVKETVVMRDPITKRSRGFGFVVFSDPKTVDNVQNHHSPHTIDGKKVDPKRAIPKKPPPGQNNQFKKVFVGGLAPDTTPQDLTDYFETFGKVKEVLLMHDKATKRLRGFGFVTFEVDSAGKLVCETGFHKIKGKSVECKRAQPKEVMMLQVNLSPFPFGRGYPSGISSAPISFGFPDWAYNPQLYQHLANAMHYGRGRGYPTGYNGAATQGFVNMPDHRRTPTSTQYLPQYQEAPAATLRARTDVVTSNEPVEYDTYNHVQMATYGAPQNNIVTPASPLSQAFTQTTSPDIGGYLTTSRAGLPDHHLYHNAPAGSPQGPFGHGMPQITLRH